VSSLPRWRYLVLVVFAAPVLAQSYPNRTVTIIVPYSAGGPVDPACPRDRK